MTMRPIDLVNLKCGDKVRSPFTGRVGEVKRLVSRRGFYDIEARILDGPDKGRDIVFRSDLVEVSEKAEPA